MVLGTGSATAGAAPAPELLPVPIDEPPAMTLRGEGRAALELPANADIMALDAILDHAYAGSPEVQVARARIGLGDAAITGEPRVQWNPEVWIGVGMRTNALGRHFELQSQLDQRIEIFGERRMRIRAAKAYKKELEQGLAVVEWSVYTAVHAAYNAALLAKQRAETAAGIVAFSGRLVEIARRRALAGEISDLRVRVAEGEYAQAKQQKLAADLDLRVAANRLAEAAGWPVGRVIIPAGELQPPIAVSGGDDLYAAALGAHPELLAQRAAVNAAEARLAAADRDRMPEPMVGAFYSRELEPGGVGVPSHVGLATVTVPIPLWQRNQRARAQAQAELRVREAELGALEYRLGLQVQRAVEAVNTAAERVRTYTGEVLPRFEENLALLEQAFTLGEVDLIEVSVARARFLSIQNEALEAYENYNRAILDYEQIVGGRFGVVTPVTPGREARPAPAPRP